jgi:hypothetical protein
MFSRSFASSRASLFHHRVMRRADDLGRDRALHDVADLDEHVAELATGLGDERWIGGHAIDEPHRGGLANLFDICGIDEELHGAPPLAPYPTTT